MVSSDDDYIQDDDDFDENDFNLGGSSSLATNNNANVSYTVTAAGNRSYGTRASAASSGAAGGGSKAKGKNARAKERWEGTISKDFGSLREDTEGRVTESLESMIEARKRKR